MGVKTARQSGSDSFVYGQDPVPFYSVNSKTTKNSPVWIRNPSWIALPSVANTEQKVVGLVAVSSNIGNSNFLAVTCAGNYTVNWGDGNTENFSSGVTAYHQYYWDNSSLANGNVTLTDTGDTVSRIAHGYQNGQEVRLYNIVSTTGIAEGKTYYVINSSSDSFQISSTPDGAAVALTTNGSASLLPYKIATVTITPQVGANLTSLNFNPKHNQTNLQNYYDNGWLDITISAPNLTSLTFWSGAGSYSRCWSLENVRILSLGSISSFANLFVLLRNLQSVSFECSTSSVTSCASMFEQCHNLRNAPYFDTSNVTNMAGMFYLCYSLETVPLYNTKKVESTNTMFSDCYNLEDVPLFDTRAMTTMGSMFKSCYRLRTIPLFNTKNVTNFTQVFYNCYALVSVPLLDMRSGTDASSMFYGCSSLKTIPQLNLSTITTAFQLFYLCSSLIDIPNLSFNACQSFNSMFYGCGALRRINGKLSNTNLVSTTAAMFQACNSLVEAPDFDTSAVTNMSYMFYQCYSLEYVPAYSTATVTNLSNMFNSCYNLQNTPVIDCSAATNIGFMFSQCYNLKNVNLANTSLTTATTFLFSTCPSLTTANVTGMRVSHTYDSCRLSKEALEKIFKDLGYAVGSQTVTITNNWGATTVYSRSGGATDKSNIVTMADTSSLATNMDFSSTLISGFTGNDIVVVQNTGNVIVHTDHGLANNEEIVFLSLTNVNTSYVTTNTAYYTQNVTTDTFQLSTAVDGATIEIVTSNTSANGSGNMYYGIRIETITTNTSITVSKKSRQTTTQTTNSSSLNRSLAKRKGWTVSG